MRFKIMPPIKGEAELCDQGTKGDGLDVAFGYFGGC